MIVVCAYCRRRRVDGQWLAALPAPAGVLVSHGICDGCFASVIEPMLKREEADSE